MKKKMKIEKNLKIFVSLFLIFSFLGAFAEQKPIILLPADIQKSPSISHVPDAKFEAALNLAVELSQKAGLVNLKERDSIINYYSKSGEPISALSLAKEMNADYIVFTGANQLNNILRLELIFKPTNFDLEDKKAIAYSYIRYKQTEDDKHLYDPALLKAHQRAFAKAFGLDSIYLELEEPFNVKPVEPLVIGGLVFDKKDVKPLWKLFDTQEISSYHAAEAMFDVAILSNDYMTYDIASRDSLYSLAKLYGIENYNSPTSVELQVLQNMEVKYYLSGYIERLNNAANISITLYEINDYKLVPLKSEKGILERDDMDELGDKIEEITSKLLNINIIDD